MVVNALRERINSGEYQVDDWLPTERALGEDFNVDRRIVRAAVNQLVRDGLVDRQPHCRPVVIRAKMEEPESRDSAVSSHARDPLPTSKFVALVMYYGVGVAEHQSSRQRILWGVNQALAEIGYHAVFLELGKTGAEEGYAEGEATYLRYVLDKGFGGAIFYPHAFRSNQEVVQEVMRHVPLVMVDRRTANVQSDFVCTSSYGALHDIVMHLVEKGHRRIAYITRYEPIQPVQDRIQGYIDAVNEAKIDEIILTMPLKYVDHDWAVFDTVFRLPVAQRPTAAAIVNDYAACEVLKRLERLGLSVPGDVALTGFDDVVPYLPNGVGLTTVAQPYEEIGTRAAQLFIKRLKDPATPFESVELPAKLIVRESSSAQL